MNLTIWKTIRTASRYALLIAALCLCACKGSKDEPDPGPEETLLLEFSEKALSNKASEFNMDVVANCDWSFSVDVNWAYIIEPRTAYNGPKTLTIGVLKNDTTSERTATFTFTYAKGTKQLKVTQTAFEVFLETSEQEVQFGYRNAQKIIHVTSNCGWDAKSSQEWLAVKPITGLVGSFEMTLEVQTNEKTEARTAEVRIWNEKYSLEQVIHVTQKKNSAALNRPYIDEYSIEWGDGIEINGLVWAPVNCGYHEENYPYGKVYQWGRKQGIGYHDSDISDPTPTELADIWTGENGAEDPSTYYKYGEGSTFSYDWIVKGDNTFWNKGTEQDPIKNEAYDPCPEGWRLPTAYEFGILLESTSGEWIEKEVKGLELTAKPHPDKQLFLPAAGRINALDGLSYDRSIEGYYWTNTANEGSSAYLFFYQDGQSVNQRGSRAGGCSIRCIQE